MYILDKSLRKSFFLHKQDIRIHYIKIFLNPLCRIVVCSLHFYSVKILWLCFTLTMLVLGLPHTVLSYWFSQTFLQDFTNVLVNFFLFWSKWVHDEDNALQVEMHFISFRFIQAILTSMWALWIFPEYIFILFEQKNANIGERTSVALHI